MYQIDRNEELTPLKITAILDSFQTRELPLLKRCWDYYTGNHRIMMKTPTDAGKPCNKIVVNYCYNIVENYLGYLTGIPVRYENDNFDAVLDVLNYNDEQNENSSLLRNALIYGVAYEVNYIDEEGKQRFKVFDPRECIPVYDNTLNNDLLYVIRFYKIESYENTVQDAYYVEVYGSNNTVKYSSSHGYSSLSLIDEQPSFFGMCPVTVFSLNDDKASIFHQVTSLQDSYNQLLSDEVDDFDAFADAYLVLKGMTADDEDLIDMKQNRVLIMDTDATAEYLTKSISDTQIANMLQNINDQIHKISNSPDFNDEKFLAQSGIAMRYKLIGFENQSSAIESNMRKALQRRIELISSILSLTGSDELWRDVSIIFTRNLPATLTPSTPQEVMQYKGLVSDRTLISLLPFVDNPDEELELVKDQNEANMSLYSFGQEADDDELLE